MNDWLLREKMMIGGDVMKLLSLLSPILQLGWYNHLSPHVLGHLAEGGQGDGGGVGRERDGRKGGWGQSGRFQLKISLKWILKTVIQTLCLVDDSPRGASSHSSFSLLSSSSSSSLICCFVLRLKLLEYLSLVISGNLDSITFLARFWYIWAKSSFSAVFLKLFSCN